MNGGTTMTISKLFGMLQMTARIVGVAGGLGILLVGFQNCNSGWQVDEETLSSNLDQDPPGGGQALDGRLLYVQNCSGCHGSVDNSTKANRSAFLIRTAFTEVPQMRALSWMSAQEVEAIAAAISTNTIPTPETPQSLFACNPAQVPKTPLLRLTNREFRSSLNALLDDFHSSLKNDSQLATLLNAIPSDTVTQDRDTLKEQALLNSQPIFNATFNAAYRAATVISGHNTGLQNYPGTSQCLGNSTLTQSCHQNFVRELSRKAFRRPLTTTESNTLSSSLWNASLSKADQLQTTITAMILMPEFGFKAFDQGTALNVAPNTRQMTAHELSSKLSFFLTGAPPDATLRARADSGQILTDSVLSSEIDRLIALPAARNTIVRLFRESFGYDHYDNFVYSNSFLNGISTSGLRDAMTQELDNFFYDVVVTRRGTFEDIFTSTSTQISHGGLASIYGVSTSATNLPAIRGGFLNRASMLTKRSGSTASPIKRGLKILEHVLCEEVGLPPPSAPTSLPVVNEHISTRERSFRTTEAAGTSCVSCHSRMNNLGYPLEQFDSLGRYRTAESLFNNAGEFVTQVAINSNATTRELTGRDVTVTGAANLSEELGKSDKAMMCFMKHLTRFESRMVPGTPSNCHMNAGLTVLYKQNGSSGVILDAIKNYIMAPEFRRWSY